MPKRTIRESERTSSLVHHYKLDIESIYEEAIWQAAIQQLPLGKLTPSMQKLLLHAEQEALQLGDEAHIGDEHLFLALLNKEEGPIAEILHELNVTELLRARLLELLQSPSYRQGSNDVFDQMGKRIGFMHVDAEGERFIGDADGKPLNISLNADGSTLITDQAGNTVQIDEDGRITANPQQ